MTYQEAIETAKEKTISTGKEHFVVEMEQGNYRCYNLIVLNDIINDSNFKVKIIANIYQDGISKKIDSNCEPIISIY